MMFNEFLFIYEAEDFEIKFHWSVLLTLFSAMYYLSSSIVGIFIGFFSVLLIILIHELGHYYIAKIYDYRVDSIVVHYLGGYCEHEEPHFEFEDIMISLGGVLAQTILLIFSLVIWSFIPGKYNSNLIYFFDSLLLGMFVYYNLFIIVFNLIPFKGFDGYTAWRIVKYVKFPSFQSKKLKKKKPNISKEEAKKIANEFVNNAINNAKKKNKN